MDKITIPDSTEINEFDRSNSPADSKQDLEENPNRYQTSINGTCYFVTVASSETATKSYEDLIKGLILNQINDFPAQGA